VTVKGTLSKAACPALASLSGSLTYEKASALLGSSALYALFGLMVSITGTDLVG